MKLGEFFRRVFGYRPSRRIKPETKGPKKPPRRLRLTRPIRMR